VRILGRATECTRLAELLDEAGSGRGRGLVLRGEAGIGKTALLDHLADSADGFTVVRATGVEFESGLALAALGELIRPLSGLLGEVPPAHADVLANLVSYRTDDGAVIDRHAVYAATLALLTVAAAKQPLLCLIDDAHWIDTASAEALLFATRRLRADAVLIVFASRDVPEFDAPGVETLQLAGLDMVASLRLLARSGDLPATAGARLAVSAMGNPLALLALPRLLASVGSLDPLPSNKTLQRAFGAHLSSMSDRHRLALLVCAAAGHAEFDVVARALAEVDLDLADLDEGAARGLVLITARTVVFRHPMVRSAVYAQAGPGERRAAHRALAEVCVSDEDLRAWHRAHVTAGPDETVASELVTTAGRARRRGGIAAEAEALERAAELTAEPVMRARRLFAAAAAWSAAGAPERSDALLDQAGAGRTRARTVEKLSAVAEEGGPDDRLAAGRLLSATAPRTWSVGDRLEKCSKVMVVTSPDGRPNPAFPAGAVRMASAQVLAGLPAGAELARNCVVVCERHEPTGACAELGEVLTYTEDYDLARRMIDRDVDGARAAGDIAVLAFSLARRAHLEVRRGRLGAANSDALEGAEIAGVMGLPSVSAATLAMVAAAFGSVDDCAAHAVEALRLGDPEVETTVRHALGLIALAAGRIEDAVTELRRADTLLRDAGVVDPAVVPAAADLVEALLRAGRADEARRVLSRLDGAVAVTGRRGRLAAALRCHALSTRDATAGALFAQALEAHADVDEPLEHARTLLCFGQWLRRARRRQDAQRHLAAALEIFESTGARLWADQARHELNVLGLRANPRPDLGALTAQESRIALAAARGQTSREIAAQVLLSVRTVDHHLGNVYRKLGVPSRRALVLQLRLADS
jgi:DNA-binding CsgD family transcriptional regulator